MTSTAASASVTTEHPTFTRIHDQQDHALTGLTRGSGSAAAANQSVRTGVAVLTVVAFEKLPVLVHLETFRDGRRVRATGAQEGNRETAGCKDERGFHEMGLWSTEESCCRVWSRALMATGLVKVAQAPSF